MQYLVQTRTIQHWFVKEHTQKKRRRSMLRLLKPLIRNANRTSRLYAAITITAPPKYNYKYNFISTLNNKDKIQNDILTFSPKTILALEELGIENPTTSQEKAIIHAVNGRDVAMFTRTGTGKTLAYALSAVEKLILSGNNYNNNKDDNNIINNNNDNIEKIHVKHSNENDETENNNVIDNNKNENNEIKNHQLIPHPKPKRPSILVIVPTRELCLQVSNVFKPFSHNLKFSMYNMQQDHIEKQRVKRLDRGVNVLISTPGRLKQHLDSNTLHLSKLEFVVIDEADTTINDFRDVRNILRSLLSRRIVDGPKKPKKKRPDCQFFLTSATANNAFLRDIRKKFVNIIEVIDNELHKSVPTLQTLNIKCGNLEKLIMLEKILTPEPTLIFCNNISSCRAIEHSLNSKGFDTGMYNSEMPPHLRKNSYRSFLKQEFDYLICTDIAARGLDILHVKHVINFDFPKTTSEYVHRAGRTARFGAKGKLTNLYTKREKELVHNILNPNVFVNRNSKGEGKARLETSVDIQTDIYRKRIASIEGRSDKLKKKIYMEDVNGDNRIRRQILGGGGNRRTINEPYNDNNDDSYLYDDYNKRKGKKYFGTKGRKYKHDFNTRVRGVVRKKRKQEQRRQEVERSKGRRR